MEIVVRHAGNLEIKPGTAPLLAGRILELEGEMTRRFGPAHQDHVRYKLTNDTLIVQTTQPFAPHGIYNESSCIPITHSEMEIRSDFEGIIDKVAGMMPALLKAARYGRKRDLLLGRRSDDKGNVVTDVMAWKFDPLYEPLARAVGVDPTLPVLLTPSVYENDPENGPRTKKTITTIAKVEGLLQGCDMIEIVFDFHKGPIESISLCHWQSTITLRDSIPESTIHSLRGRPISELMAMNRIDSSLLSRKIIDSRHENDRAEFLIEDAKFVRVSQ